MNIEMLEVMSNDEQDKDTGIFIKKTNVNVSDFNSDKNTGEIVDTFDYISAIDVYYNRAQIMRILCDYKVSKTDGSINPVIRRIITPKLLISVSTNGYVSSISTIMSNVNDIEKNVQHGQKYVYKYGLQEHKIKYDLNHLLFDIQHNIKTVVGDIEYYDNDSNITNEFNKNYSIHVTDEISYFTYKMHYGADFKLIDEVLTKEVAEVVYHVIDKLDIK